MGEELLRLLPLLFLLDFFESIVDHVADFMNGDNQFPLKFLQLLDCQIFTVNERVEQFGVCLSRVHVTDRVVLPCSCSLDNIPDTRA